jgi:hypothetical protein
MVPILLNLDFLLESRHMGSDRHCSRQANRKLLRALFTPAALFAGRAQNSPPPFTPHRERASGKALTSVYEDLSQLDREHRVCGMQSWPNHTD